MMKHRSPRRRTQNSGERNHNNTEVKTGLETREGRKKRGAGRCVQSPPEKPGTWGRQTAFPGKGQEIEDSLAFMVEDCIKRLAELWERVETQSIKDN